MWKLVGFTLLFIYVFVGNGNCQEEASRLLIRIDDIGMNHSVNMALKELAETKLPLSASVMFTCPWYQEAADILADNPQITVGIHLTLNSEWKNYRWGPVLGQGTVPSLVNDHGFFRPTVSEFLESAYDLAEVEMELEAQIQRALAYGVKLEYMDFHMGTVQRTPQLIAITDRLAKKYNLKKSGSFQEVITSPYGFGPEDKVSYFLEELDKFPLPNPMLMIVHAAKDHPEMKAVADLNNPEQGNEGEVARHRQAELDMLLSEKVKSDIARKKIQLITYRDL